LVRGFLHRKVPTWKACKTVKFQIICSKMAEMVGNQ